ncbi:MAG: CARDB domain-containing protein [Dehalococcoidales bacterium]|nr:CARDB domain-containing protein [Dehalococcoidales bacterium]
MKRLVLALLVSLLLLTACGAPASVPPTATGGSASQVDSRITELEKELKAKEEAIAKLQQQMQEQQRRLDALTPPPPSAPLVPATFVLTELTITPTEVTAGEVVTISIEVSNTGGIEGSYTVVFKVKLDWTTWENVEVTLMPGQTKTVTFTTKGASRMDTSGVFKVVSGTYTVDVNGKVGQFTVTEPPPTHEELEAKQVIQDLAYVKILTFGYSDDADPERDGISLHIAFYNSNSERIEFSDIPVIVNIEIYKYPLTSDGFYNPRVNKLAYEQKVTIDSAFGLFGAEIKIPYEDMAVSRAYFEFGDIKVIVITPKQGDFRDEQGLVPLYD